MSWLLLKFRMQIFSKYILGLIEQNMKLTYKLKVNFTKKSNKWNNNEIKAKLK